MGKMISKCCRNKKKEIERKREIVEEGSSLQCFKIFDENLDGALTASEIYDTFKQMDFLISRNEVRDIIKKFDKDGNGMIDRKEFMEFMRLFLRSNRTAFQYVFNVFDEDGDGEINLQEFVTTMNAMGKSITEKEADSLLMPYYNSKHRIDQFRFVKVLVDYLERTSITRPISKTAYRSSLTKGYFMDKHYKYRDIAVPYSSGYKTDTQTLDTLIW